MELSEESMETGEESEEEPVAGGLGPRIGGRLGFRV